MLCVAVQASESGINTPTDNIIVRGGREHRPELTAQLSSGSIYVYNMEEGVVVYAKNHRERVFPAATTMIMTALVVLEQEADLTKKITFPNTANAEFAAGNWNPNKLIEDTARAGFDHERAFSIEDALYGLMLPSGVDAALALAFYVGEGKIADFVALMNKKAQEIGANDTNFTNPHGLFEPDHYTTAYDMFKLTRYVLTGKYSNFFRALVGTGEYNIPNTAWNEHGIIVNDNMLSRSFDGNPYFYQPAFGVKTGGFHQYFTRNLNGSGDSHGGGWDRFDGVVNLVSVARRNDLTYITVTMGAPWHFSANWGPGENWYHYAFHDHRNLYEWAFSKYEKMRVMQRTDPMGKVKVTDGEKTELNLFPLMTEDYWTLLPKGVDVTDVVRFVPNIFDTEIAAPVAEGAILGSIEIHLNNEILKSYPLVTTESVERTQRAKMWDWVRGTFFNEAKTVTDEQTGTESTEYKLKWQYALLLVLLGIGTIALIIMSYIRKHRKAQRERFKKKYPNKRIRR
jgi:D-alanyl-D-alanine carboxypeptidase (penicillin-binding protein 5/6)